MNKLRRITAFLSVVVIVVCVIAAFILGVMGSKYFLGMLVLAIIIPAILWVFMWFTRFINGDSDVISKEDMEALEKEAVEKGNGAGTPTP